MDEESIKLLLDQQTKFLSAQNTATHEKIDALAGVVTEHVKEDTKVWAKVNAHEGTLSVLKQAIFWVGSACLGAVGLIAGWMISEK